jgi:hypothetical protein
LKLDRGVDLSEGLERQRIIGEDLFSRYLSLAGVSVALPLGGFPDSFPDSSPMNRRTSIFWEDRTERGHFDCKICKDIKESLFTIFELSEKSLDVAFEFGLNIGFGKDYFIIKKKNAPDLPSDVSGLNFGLDLIIYYFYGCFYYYINIYNIYYYY